MQVFVTGATGFIGSAVTVELLTSGHRVLGLARSDRGVGELERMGAQALPGDLQAPEILRKGVEMCEAVIHTGFVHDFSRFAEACEIDRAAIETLGAAIGETHKPFIVTAGLAGLGGAGRPATESDVAPPPSTLYPRASDMAARALSGRGVPTGIMRLPPSVHGRGDHGFVPMLIDMARRRGHAAYIGAGENAWSAVHVSDAARAFRLAIERGPSAEIYHAAGEQGVPFRAIAEAIAVGLDLPCVSLGVDEARGYFGWFFSFVSMDMPAASERTQGLLRWRAGGPGLLSDIAEAGYFS